MITVEKSNRLRQYISTFKIKRDKVAGYLDMLTSKFNYELRRKSMKKDFYLQVLEYLQVDAKDNELKLFLVNHWLSLEDDKRDKRMNVINAYLELGKALSAIND